MTFNDLIDLAALDGRRTRSAIYAVEHVPSGRRLICQTTNLSKRLFDQRQYLDRRRHHNPELQADLVRDGPDAFRLVLLELIDSPRHLALLKRVYVEDARRRGLAYNPPDSKPRRSLASELAGRQAGGIDSAGGDDDPLGHAVAQLKALGEMSRTNPRAASVWLALPPEKDT